MSDSIQIKKLKRIMYSVLRWRLQVPNYYPHNPIPADDNLSEFSRGVKCAYMDLLEEIEKIEAAENQRSFWGKRQNDLNDDDAFLDEIRR